MHFEPEKLYHIYNRSFNKFPIFPKPQNYQYFLKKISGLTSMCDILAYCLMPNHFHLLLYIPLNSEGCDMLNGQNGGFGMQNLARKIGTMLSSYTQGINKQEGRNGSLFQPKSKAKALNDGNYRLTCFNYIHQNPLKAGLVKKIENWKYSSFNEYYLEMEGICNKEIATQLMDIPSEPAKFYLQSYGVIDPDFSRGFD